MFNTILVFPIFNLLAVIYAYVRDFGLAIIILTLLMRILIWPLINKQLHSQRALQELQPELQRIKKEAKGDRQLEGKLTMELYKEKEINPFASILPLLIQVPIFLALFVVLREIIKPGEIEKISYVWVKHLPAIAAIIGGHVTLKPTLLGLVLLTKPSVILAVLAGLAQFVQTRQLTPKQKPQDQQAQVMASMTYMFPIITFVIGLTVPAALSLYWLTASLMAVFQQYLVLHRDVRELEDGTPTPALSSGSTKPKAVKAKADAKGGKA
jgi:YidC/Oxa1 family membrane protein insertase